MNISEPFIRRPVAMKLLTIGLSVAAVLGLGLTISKALSYAMCRGIDCMAWTAEAQGRGYAISLVDKCFYLGSPTGIGGIFSHRRFGRTARSLLGQEYMLFGTEFLFIEPRRSSDPIIVIDANRYWVEFPPEAFCNRGATTVKLDAESKRIEVEGCTSGVVKPIGRENECRIDEDGQGQEKASGGSPLP